MSRALPQRKKPARCICASIPRPDRGPTRQTLVVAKLLSDFGKLFFHTLRFLLLILAVAHILDEVLRTRDVQHSQRNPGRTAPTNPN
eukprot:354275-Chlamydomonas_euryale.AAC.6